MYLAYITCTDYLEAKKIALNLLENRLIACANVITNIDSFYWWNGQIENQKETLLLCKTNKQKINSIKKTVKEIHSYEVPAIEFIEIKDSDKDYEKWIEKELKIMNFK